MNISLSLFIMCHPRINRQMLMQETKLGLTNTDLRRFMGKPKLRMEKAKSLEDLLDSSGFSIRHHPSKLPMKVRNGYLVKHRYTQEKKGI